jgi:hypothetical protein
MPASTRRRRASTAAALTSLLLGSLSAVALSAAPAQAAVTPVTAGAGLDWGIKESWRNYIGAAGTTLSDGATRNEDGTFHLPVAGGSYDDATRTTVVGFAGTIEFLGHCHGAGGTHVRPCDLDLTLDDIRVEITEDHASVFVDAESRPIAGGEIVRYDDVPLVDLDVEDAAPVVSGGATRWSDLAATMTIEGERIFNYGAGTVVDPVSFGYDGPGGKPVGETWDAPGRTVHHATPADPQPAEMPTRVMGTLSDGSLVGWGNGARVAILDPQTLAPRSAWVRGPGVTGDIVRDSIAIDPATDTIFASTMTTNQQDRRLTTFDWDGTTLTVTEVAGSHAPDLIHDGGNAGAWDPENDRYVVARARSNTASDLWEVVDVAGTWTARKLGPVTLSVTGGWSFENSIVNLVAVPDNGRTVFLATTLFGGKPLQRIVKVGNGYRGEPLAEAGDIQPDRVLRTRNGVYALAAGDRAVYLPLVGYADNRRLADAEPAVPFNAATDSNLNLGALVSDYATDTLVGVTDSSTNLTRLQRGAVVARGPLDSGPYGGGHVLGLTPDGDVWGVLDGQLQVVGSAGVSPAFPAQPTAPTADLVGDTATVNLSAEVTGTPTPTLTWQTRIVGQSWTDVTEGADGATLSDEVTAADTGRQYRLVAENAAGRVASERVSLELRTPPRIMVQPADVAAAPGDDVELKVMPDGTPAPDVQWQQRIGGVWHDVPGESGATLRLGDVDASLSGTTFRARLTNPVGSVTSERATVTVAEPATEVRAITSGTVDWGVKVSFRNYISGPIAHGQITTTGGVTANSDGTYAFPVVDGEWDPRGTSTVNLGGSVRFTGHDGATGPQLDLTITEPRIVIGADDATLVADVTSRGLSSGQTATYDDVVLADLDTDGRVQATGDTLSLSNVPATLTAAGVPAFADFYPAATALDPLSGTLGLGDVPEEPGTPEEPVTTATTVLVGGATPYGRGVPVRVAVSAEGRQAVNGTAQLTAAGRTWTAPVVDGRASSTTPAGIVPGSYAVQVRFLGAGRLAASAGSDSLRITKATPSVRAKLPKKTVRRAARARLAVVATVPGSSLRATGKIVVRDGRKVILRATLKPNASGTTRVRLPRLARGNHRLTVTVKADPRLRSATSKPVVLRVR